MLELFEGLVHGTDCLDRSCDEMDREHDGKEGHAGAVHVKHDQSLEYLTRRTLGKGPRLRLQHLHIRHVRTLGGVTSHYHVRCRALES